MPDVKEVKVEDFIVKQENPDKEAEKEQETKKKQKSSS